MANDFMLPIKVVFKQDGDFRPRKASPVDTKPLGPVTQALRDLLADRVAEVGRHFAPAFKRWPNLPAVAKVALKPEAIAKYRRPTYLFNSRTCPIIGGGAPGELFVSASPTGLHELERRVRAGVANDAEANISTLESLDPYSPEDALCGTSAETLSRFVQEHAGRPLKFKLFRHQDANANKALRDGMLDYLRELQVGDIEVLEYTPNMSVYALHEVRPETVASLASFVGTQSLSTFPNYRVVRTASRAVDSVSATNFPPPDPTREYGLVGMIDSGTDPNNSHLRSWVVARHSHHPQDQQDNGHGSFVAGMIIHPRLLNHGDARFPDVSSRVVDVVAIDKTGMIDEYDLRTVIDDSLNRFPNVRVWNMSLAMDGQPCQDNEFSDFGAFIDAVSRKHDVLFHLPAGNFVDLPLRTWPPQDGLDESDRIAPPADSVRSLVIGSTAHRDSTSSRVRSGHPSPFSRRGPGGAYLMKPELSAPAGNCDAAGNCHQIGVLSLDGAGHIAENIGTSFASPQVASISANVLRELQVGGEAPSTVLVKALQLHSAFVSTGRIDVDLVNYGGLGCPPDIDTILNCTQSSATCVFQIPVSVSPRFVRRPFPMPQCLVDANGRLVAEVFMTLYYDPPLDRRFRAEYCRTNVTASLGTLHMVRDPKTGEMKEQHARKVAPVPKELDEGWESELIKNGFKWSPLKLYHHRFRGMSGNAEWQLCLNLLERSEFTGIGSQDVYLLITIRDPAGEKEVYNEMVQSMQRLGWITENLQTRSRARLEG